MDINSTDNLTSKGPGVWTPPVQDWLPDNEGLPEGTTERPSWWPYEDREPSSGTGDTGTTTPGGDSGNTTNPGGGTTTPGGDSGNTTNPGGGITTPGGNGESTTNPGGGTTTPGGDSGNTTNPGGGTTTPGGNGGNTTNPGGGTTTPGGDSGNTTNPGGGTTTPGGNGGNTTNPGGGTTTPGGNGGNTTNPGGGTTTPGGDSGNTTNPGGGTTTPGGDGGNTTNPGGGTTTPGGSSGTDGKSDSYQSGWDNFQNEQKAQEEYRQGYEDAKKEWEANHPTQTPDDNNNNNNGGTTTPSGDNNNNSNGNNNNNSDTNGGNEIPDFPNTDAPPSSSDSTGRPTNGNDGNGNFNADNGNNQNNYGDINIKKNDDGSYTIDTGGQKITVGGDENNKDTTTPNADPTNDSSTDPGTKDPTPTDGTTPDGTKNDGTTDTTGANEIPEVPNTDAPVTNDTASNGTTPSGGDTSSGGGTPSGGSTGGGGGTPSGGGGGNGNGYTGANEIPEVPNTDAPATSGNEGGQGTPSGAMPTEDGGSTTTPTTGEELTTAQRFNEMPRENVLEEINNSGMTPEEYAEKYPETKSVLIDKGLYPLSKVPEIQAMADDPEKLQQFIDETLKNGDLTYLDLLKTDPELKDFLEANGITIPENVLEQYNNEVANGGTGATATSTGATGTSGTTTNETFSLDVEKAGTLLDGLSTDFTQIVRAINGLVHNLGDLQNNFYSPSDKDTTLIYDECAKNIGVGSTQGLYPAVLGAFEWCSAVDQYVQDKEGKNGKGDVYSDSI